MKLKKLHYTVDDGIAVVQLDYPKNLNAIDEEMADELLYVVQAAEADESVKVVVFKGSPPCFFGWWRHRLLLPAHQGRR